MREKSFHLHNKLEITGIDHLFDPHIYSADLVSKGKPDPAIYLHAAERLSISPSACLAIEDSINGVQSATAAGMTTIGFTAGKHCQSRHDELLRQAGAHMVVESMQALAIWLQNELE